MGILNGWFTTKGFANYSVANGKLADGDEIRVMYSWVGAGKDLGQSWENADIACKVGETATLTVAATAAEGAALTLTNESWTSSIGCTIKNLNIQGTENVVFEDHGLISTIEGVDLGGILGGDEYVCQARGEVWVKDTVFTGKVEGEKNVGAIIGFYDSLSKYDTVSNNLFSADCGATKGIAAVDTFAIQRYVHYGAWS